jgi:Trk-type K+ transport system membrane component
MIARHLVRRQSFAEMLRVNQAAKLNREHFWWSHKRRLRMWWSHNKIRILVGFILLCVAITVLSFFVYGPYADHVMRSLEH